MSEFQPARPVIHDGEADAMPCRCRECTRQRIRDRQAVVNDLDAARTTRGPADILREARAC